MLKGLEMIQHGTARDAPPQVAEAPTPAPRVEHDMPEGFGPASDDEYEAPHVQGNADVDMGILDQAIDLCTDDMSEHIRDIEKDMLSMINALAGDSNAYAR